MASSRLVILPYKAGSISAKHLAESLTTSLRLKVRRVKHDGLYHPKHRSIILNYGSSQRPQWCPPEVKVINPFVATVASGNKLVAFRAFQATNLSIPEWTDSRAVAETWIQEGFTVVCRTILNAHSGRGIALASDAAGLVNAPLYVKYKKKKKEFRVHVFNGQVIDVAEKRRTRREGVNPDSLIRNHANGWVFCRDNVVEPADLRPLALAACVSLGLDFGAVDIIWNEHEGRCYLLEVNTAPGIEGTTLERYTQAVVNYLRMH